MALLLKIDGYDLSNYVRVTPGEGFDPMDPEIVQPGFGQAGDEGAPLISTSVDNREMVFPIHLNPLKDPAYADTKDGLHQQIVDLNALLSRARQVEWRDDGATNSTFYDVQFARFEPDYNYRRSQRLWASGVLRVWAKPYGTSGTYRTIGTALGTGVGVPVSIPAGSVLGDIGAFLQVTVGAGSYGNTDKDARLLGVAVVPSGYAWEIPVASMAIVQPAISGVTLGATTAPGNDPVGLGSQSMWINYSRTPAVRISLSPATMYAGRNRIFAVARGNARLHATDDTGFRFGQGYASMMEHNSHGLIDLGVLEVSPELGLATVSFGLGADGTGEYVPFTSPPQNNKLAGSRAGIELNRILVLPENNLSLSVDQNRTLLAYHSVRVVNAASQYNVGSYLLTDMIGNRVGSAALGVLYGIDRTLVIGSTATYRTWNALVNIDESTDVDAQVAFSFGAAGTKAITISGDDALFGLGSLVYSGQIAQANATQAGMALTIGGALAASVGFNTPSYGILDLRTVAGRAVLSCRSFEGSTLASITATSPYVGLPIDAVWFGMSSASVAVTENATTAAFFLHGFNVESMPSVARGPRDKAMFGSATQSMNLLSSASTYLRSLRSTARGAIPDLSPSSAMRVIALTLPMAGNQAAADVVDVSVDILERWRYAR